MTDKEAKIKMLIERGVAELISRSHFIKQLKGSRKLRIKLGIDPTAKDLHLGHAVILRKLRQFQELGHKVILIFGDFTALVGDPSDRASGRIALTRKQVKDNLKSYKHQAAKILDFEKVEVHFNSAWFSKKKFDFFLELGRHFTVSQLIEREDIQKRFRKKQPVSFIEIIYPLLQGYDSVEVRADVELGGVDQRLNLLFGREIQRLYNQTPQDIMTLNYLIGLDGKSKMSKTYNNTIDLGGSADDIFGKVMSIKDELIIQYYELLTNKLIPRFKSSEARDLKISLAQEVTKEIYNINQAKEAKDNFIKTFVKKEGKLAKPTKVKKGEWRLDELLFEVKAVSSKSEAQRLIKQRAVEVGGEVWTDWQNKFRFSKPVLLRVGKHRFYKLMPK
jgi:tyrosyl-tRNA synthetase